MTVTRTGLSHAGAIPETIIPGIMALKPDWERETCVPWTPLPARLGPPCAGCWDHIGVIKPAALCRITYPGHGLPLDAITHKDVALEGFWWRSEFIEMFCRRMRCTPSTEVTRVEWRYLDGAP